MVVRYPNLRAEMARRGMKNSDLCTALNMKNSTFSGKINGKSAFMVDEALRIKAFLNTEMPIEVLFLRSEA